eukprot:5354256-Amphidinium_carterae.1
MRTNASWAKEMYSIMKQWTAALAPEFWCFGRAKPLLVVPICFRAGPGVTTGNILPEYIHEDAAEAPAMAGEQAEMDIQPLNMWTEGFKEVTFEQVYIVSLVL